MEKNCLVTTLLGNVNVEGGEVFNTVVLHVTQDLEHQSELAYIGRIGFAGEGKIHLKVAEGNPGYFATSSALSEQLTDEEFTLTSDVMQTKIYVPNMTFDIVLTGMYNLTQVAMNSNSVENVANLISFDANKIGYNPMERLLLTCSNVEFDIKYLKNMPDLSYLTSKNCPNVTGDIGVLKNRTFTFMSIGGSNVSGTLAQLLEIPAYQGKTTLDVSRSVFPKIGGDIAALANETQLTSLNLSGNKRVFGSIESLVKLTNLTTLILADAYANAFTGSIENFVAGQIANGRTQVTTQNKIFCPWILTYATFGGNYYTSQGGMWLTWESASKIVIYYSLTSTFNDYIRVYTKGYTQAEAEAAFPGKAIVRVDA